VAKVTGENIMSDQLLTLTRIDATGSFSKEDLFNWIVDLRQGQFDELCNQIISLYRFQQKFEGVLVSDEEDLLKPWLPILPKIVFNVESSGCNYERRFFYQFLSRVSDAELDNICDEILSLYSHARENNNTYIISQVYPAVAGRVECWRIQFKRTKLFMDLPQTIMHWQRLLFEGGMLS
jgi:hypothetical protein